MTSIQLSQDELADLMNALDAAVTFADRTADIAEYKKLKAKLKRKAGGR